MALIKEHGAPLKFTYLPKISDNINRAKGWFADAIKEHNYPITPFSRYVVDR